MSIITTTKRNLFLNDVTQSDVKVIVQSIVEINVEDDEKDKKERDYERKPIQLYIDSFGGSVYAGFSLVAAMEMSKTPVNTFCLGYAMSMGLLIFAAGKKRIAHSMATMMYHQTSTGAFGKLDDVVESVEQTKVMFHMYNNKLLSLTKIRESEIKEVNERRGNWYFSASEALKLGVCDELVG
jgi:ATP-dependent Clp protease protease subunit